MFCIENGKTYSTPSPHLSAAHQKQVATRCDVTIETALKGKLENLARGLIKVLMVSRCHSMDAHFFANLCEIH